MPRISGPCRLAWRYIRGPAIEPTKVYEEIVSSSPLARVCKTVVFFDELHRVLKVGNGGLLIIYKVNLFIQSFFAWLTFEGFFLVAGDCKFLCANILMQY